MIRAILLGVLLAGCVSEPADLGEEVATSGSFDLEWAIYDGAQMVSCVDAQASEVRIVAHALDRDAEDIHVLSCYSGIGETGAVQAGAYDITLQLMSPAGGILDSVELHDVNVADGTTPLGPIEFRP
jgi:hypothetical protein